MQKFIIATTGLKYPYLYNLLEQKSYEILPPRSSVKLIYCAHDLIHDNDSCDNFIWIKWNASYLAAHAARDAGCYFTVNSLVDGRQVAFKMFGSKITKLTASSSKSLYFEWTGGDICWNWRTDEIEDDIKLFDFHRLLLLPFNCINPPTDIKTFCSKDQSMSGWSMIGEYKILHNTHALPDFRGSSSRDVSYYSFASSEVSLLKNNLDLHLPTVLVDIVVKYFSAHPIFE